MGTNKGGRRPKAAAPPLLVRRPEAAAPMLVVWLPYVVSFLFQALQTINFIWILHDGAVVSLSSSNHFHTDANVWLSNLWLYILAQIITKRLITKG